MDGEACTECGKPSVTRDGRHLCLKCLRAACRKDTPTTGWHKGRGPGASQAYEGEPSPWGENAVRHLEGG